MKNIKNYNDFTNEEINWGKQPWRFLKNIMNLEEPEYDDVESDEDYDDTLTPKQKERLKKLGNKMKDFEKSKESPDDIVTMTTSFQISLFRPDTPDSIIKAMTLLANKYNLTGDVEHEGSMHFSLKLRGKRKDADDFYDKLREILLSY